jgi:hypothetical protein
MAMNEQIGSTGVRTGFSIQKLEGIVYLILVVGSILDHGSTMFGLALHNNLAEANPLVNWMISKNLWLLFDLSTLIFIISLTRLALLSWKDRGTRMILAYPFILGVARMAAGLWNLLLL